MAQDRVPTGRLARLSRLAGVGARSGVALLRRGAADAAATHAAEVLGQLRGLAAKIGQTLSYVDGVVPERHREAYEGALASLRDAASSSNPDEIRALVEAELGAPIAELFAEWENEPFASASIGEVHRARLPDGRRVAVKVQHPRIAEAVESDLQNAGVLKSVASMIAPRGANTDAIFEIVRARFREELDYTLEARRQTEFTALHAADPSIHIPEVISSHSSRRVLTSEYVEGATLEDVARSDEDTRRRHAEVLWRFVFRGNLVGGMFNADPHPGNYYFHADGRVTFLDFGCVQKMEPERLRHAVPMHQAAVAGDEATFRRHLRALLETRGGSYEEAVVGYTRRCFEPLFGSPFRIDRAYVASLVEGVRDINRSVWAKDKSFVGPPPSLVFMNRLQFGFYSVLARLDVAVDFAAVERGFLPPPSAGV